MIELQIDISMMNRRVPGFEHMVKDNGTIVVTRKGRRARVRAVRRSTNGNRAGFCAPGGTGWDYGGFSVKGALRRARRALAAAAV